MPGQVVLMTHLGPGPFTGNLLHLYSRRQKIRPGRRAAYGVLKAGLHLTMSGREVGVRDTGPILATNVSAVFLSRAKSVLTWIE